MHRLTSETWNTAALEQQSCLMCLNRCTKRLSLAASSSAQTAVVLAPSTGSPEGPLCRSGAGLATARAGAAAAPGQDRGEQQDVHGLQVPRLAQVHPEPTVPDCGVGRGQTCSHKKWGYAGVHCARDLRVWHAVTVSARRACHCHTWCVAAGHAPALLGIGHAWRRQPGGACWRRGRRRAATCCALHT